MKTKVTTSLIILAAFILVAPHVHATVGGPTYFGDFKYNKADESIYYILQSLNGRGCPPELVRTSLETKKTEKAFSCDQGEALGASVGYAGVGALVQDKIRAMTSGYKDLSSINLRKNNIGIDLQFVRTEKLEGEDWIIQNHFLAKVYQNGIKVDEFPITGCSVDQPFTFAGYAIPGFEKKLVIVSSTKGDCFEQGYTEEELFVVNITGLIDKTHTGEYKSPQEPLVPSESRLVVYEKDSVVAPTTDPVASPTPTTTPVTTENPNTTGIMILIALVALAAGALLGRNAARK